MLLSLPTGRKCHHRGCREEPQVCEQGEWPAQATQQAVETGAGSGRTRRPPPPPREKGRSGPRSEPGTEPRPGNTLSRGAEYDPAAEARGSAQGLPVTYQRGCLSLEGVKLTPLLLTSTSRERCAET